MPTLSSSGIRRNKQTKNPVRCIVKIYAIGHKPNSTWPCPCSSKSPRRLGDGQARHFGFSKSFSLSSLLEKRTPAFVVCYCFDYRPRATMGPPRTHAILGANCHCLSLFFLPNPAADASLIPRRRTTCGVYPDLGSPVEFMNESAPAQSRVPAPKLSLGTFQESIEAAVSV